MGVNEKYKQYGEKIVSGFSSKKKTKVVVALFAFILSSSLVLKKQIEYKIQIFRINKALAAYKKDCGCFPTSQQGLEALYEKPKIYPVPKNWKGPYLKNVSRYNPWGRRMYLK